VVERRVPTFPVHSEINFDRCASLPPGGASDHPVVNAKFESRCAQNDPIAAVLQMFLARYVAAAVVALL
jgi:hypothetical protein